jgi:hypothetical protein
MRRLANVAMFYVGWFTCVAGAGRGRVWVGPLVVAALLLVHLSLTADRARETCLILTVGLVGFAVDTLQASIGLYSFAHAEGSPGLCPPWMVALWMLFATTLNEALGWLAGRHVLAAALGALCGPASYVAGARLGAIHLSPDTIASLGGIGLVWALAMPVVLITRDALCEPGVRVRLGDAVVGT